MHVLTGLLQDLPHLGSPGSRASLLHLLTGSDLLPASRSRKLTEKELHRFARYRLTGTIGALMIGLGGLGAGALPVIGNPYTRLPFGGFLSRLLVTSSVMCLTGVMILCLSWLAMAPFVGVALPYGTPVTGRVTMNLLRRTALAWIAPLFVTAPVFSSDIYSYLAQGTIVLRGLDPYTHGPVDLLGATHPFARSVPLFWAHSPAPYGPIALAAAAAVAALAGTSIFAGVLLTRLIALAALIATAWGVARLARPLGIAARTAIWLTVLNPLVLIQLIGGLHNDSLLLGFMVPGLALSFAACENLRHHVTVSTLFLFTFGTVLIIMAGLVKMPAWVALGFTGIALVRAFSGLGDGDSRPSFRFGLLIVIAIVEGLLLVMITVGISALLGTGLGFFTHQGGATKVASWMSFSTVSGAAAGLVGRLFGIGDFTQSALIITQSLTLFAACAFMVRMLWAVWRGTIAATGGFGVSLFVMVLCLPVVQPWYILWALVPLAAWANRPFFRLGAMLTSVIGAVIILPRGGALPAGQVVLIYACACAATALFVWLATRRRKVSPTL